MQSHTSIVSRVRSPLTSNDMCLCSGPRLQLSWMSYKNYHYLPSYLLFNDEIICTFQAFLGFFVVFLALPYVEAAIEN